MALISPPPTAPVDTQDKDGTLVAVFEGWRNFFVAAFNILSGVTGSGTTAQRPTSFPWVGRPYLDTTLGKPIWMKTVKPIVWIDATGGVV